MWPYMKDLKGTAYCPSLQTSNHTPCQSDLKITPIVAVITETEGPYPHNNFRMIGVIIGQLGAIIGGF